MSIPTKDEYCHKDLQIESLIKK